MKSIRPIWISVLTMVVFVAALLIGMTTDWWQTEGRRTPLSTKGGHFEAVGESHEEGGEDHEKTSITGSSTMQDALDLGITLEQLETILEGDVDDLNASIKDTAKASGLKFGEIKDGLNALLN